MSLDDLAAQLFALEAVDSSPFQRRSRVLQSIWRTERGHPCGEHSARGKTRPLGSRLPMPWAREELANFLTERVREVVRAEVLDPRRSNGKLFGKPRIFNDLLSSQPLCFNLFGELRWDLGLASKLLAHLTGGRFTEVVAVEFEHSPSRNDVRYTSDRSAFDVFLECRTPRGGRAFVGVEVKYHEDLAGPAASHRSRWQVEEVGAAPARQSIAQHVLINLEVRAELLGKRAHPVGHHRHDEIDIVRRARLALERACQAASHEVLAPDGLERGRHPQRHVERSDDIRRRAHEVKSRRPARGRTACARIRARTTSR